MSIYEITISSVGGAAPSDGFIDNKTVYQYIADGSNPTTFLTSTAKARANRRHKSIVNVITFYSNLKITSVAAGGSPNANTAPTSIVYLAEGSIDDLVIPDEDNIGATLLGIDAARRIVSRALMKTETVGLEVFDPTMSTAPGNATSYNRTGPRFIETVVGPLYTVRATAEASVSIAKL